MARPRGLNLTPLIYLPPFFLPPPVSPQTLSDGLDRDLPLLPDADAGHEAAKASVTMWNGEMGAGGAALGPFDDEETRAFYEELPDLLAMLPPTLLGLTEEEAERLRQEHHGRKNQAPVR